uniref:Uncharacterized protein n=1 Tax=Tetranychus urticae TaxID=32264 RepID=T1L5R5_TETUR
MIDYRMDKSLQKFLPKLRYHSNLIFLNCYKNINTFCIKDFHLFCFD